MLEALLGLLKKVKELWLELAPVGASVGSVFADDPVPAGGVVLNPEDVAFVTSEDCRVEDSGVDTAGGGLMPGREVDALVAIEEVNADDDDPLDDSLPFVEFPVCAGGEDVSLVLLPVCAGGGGLPLALFLVCAGGGGSTDALLLFCGGKVDASGLLEVRAGGGKNVPVPAEVDAPSLL